MKKVDIAVRQVSPDDAELLQKVYEFWKNEYRPYLQCVLPPWPTVKQLEWYARNKRLIIGEDPKGVLMAAVAHNSVGFVLNGRVKLRPNYTSEEESEQGEWGRMIYEPMIADIKQHTGDKLYSESQNEVAAYFMKDILGATEGRPEPQKVPNIIKKGPIQRAIDATNDEEEKREIHNRMVMEAVKGLKEWEVDGVRFMVTKPAELDKRTGAVAIEIEARENGQNLPLLSRRRILNRPPFLVPSSKVLGEATTEPDGDTLEVHEVHENPLEAFKRAVSEQVLVEARQKGWER